MSPQQWQAPPGWPAPPPGWSPHPGWLPHPAWPEPPEDWQWWHQRPRTRSERWGLRALLGIGVLVVGLVGLLVVAQTLDEATGCGSVDPTGAENYSAISIVNDTPSRVIVGDCVGAYCDVDRADATLAPGDDFDDDAACGESGSGMTSWRVSKQGGALLGYIAVDSPRKHDGLVFLVSRATPDRHTPSPAV